jgi:uncharacterized protein YlaN (UPF0358 family)
MKYRPLTGRIAACWKTITAIGAQAYKSALRTQMFGLVRDLGYEFPVMLNHVRSKHAMPNAVHIMNVGGRSR